MDALISDLGGCGTYQYLVTFFVFWVKCVAGMSMVVMAFGNYNPGWTCQDDHFDEGNNDTDKCQRYDKCTSIQFTPGYSTVVTEWQLVCEKSWIPSLIISIQMVGVLLGAYLSGYLGDTIGRKRTLYISAFCHMIVNIIAIFSNSWQMFTIMRFLIGLTIPVMVYTPCVLAMEFVPFNWRNAIVCFPVFQIGCVFFAISAKLTGDWRYLHGINAAASFIALLPFFWLPESLRWLVVNDKVKEASIVVKNIAKVNRRCGYIDGTKEDFSTRYENQTESHDYSCFHLMRRGVRYSTFVAGFTVISMGTIYYALSFGVKAMPGDFYRNLVILFSTEIPMSLINTVIPNYTGRKIAIMIYLVLCTICLFSIVAFNFLTTGSLKDTGMLVSTILSRVMVDPAWDVTVTYMAEIFPTFMRSTSVAYTNWISKIGAIISPYLIPDNPDTYFINYLIMGFLALICCVLVIFIPETKGKPLPDSWELNIPEHNGESKSIKMMDDCDETV